MSADRKRNVSRRNFLKTCGAAAVASGAIWSLGTTEADAASRNGPANLLFSLDQNWLFGGRVGANPAEPRPGDEAFSKITLPHCVAKLSWEKWDTASWEANWGYRRNFALPKECANRRVFLKFDGVMTVATPAINGQVLPQHVGGYLPFSYEVTEWVKANGNVLDVTVDANWLNVPPDGNPRGPKSVDYLEPGGIIRSVNLCALPQVFISDVFAKPVDVLKLNRQVEVLCIIDAAAVASKSFEIKVELMDGSRIISTTQKKVIIGGAGKFEATLTLSKLGDITLWDVDAPHLYTVVTTLLMDGQPLHDYRNRIGFREASFTVDGFFLNGRRLQLFGLDRHEIYPYVGCAMPGRVMRRDAEILKNEFNCNVVRCSHYPQSEAFLDACDELGLMVWEETPGWGYVGDSAWEDLVFANVGDMIRRDRNHVSIVIWGVRVNESRNDQPLYRRTTALAKLLDGTRPCSGSMTGFRNWQEEWHEDVYAMDDYHSAPDGSVGIYPPLPGIPYMLSETVGQYSYGGKGFGNLYYRTADVTMQSRQALYHAEAHDRAAALPRFCGVIAWCAFEYSSLQNSHNNIKNPGVSDVFRIPKLGASFYLSQVSPKVRPVIALDFYWDFGPKSPHGPGKKAAIFSNCERLEVFVGNKAHATLHPDREGFPHLKFPPFFADLDVDGTGYPELRIDGYVGEALALSKSFSADISQDRFMLTADDTELIGDGSDATRLVFQVADKFGTNRLFGGGDVTFEVAGPGVIVGDNPFSLTDSGGVGAIWIKAVPNSVGRITIKAAHSSLGAQSVAVKAKQGVGLDLI